MQHGTEKCQHLLLEGSQDMSLAGEMLKFTVRGEQLVATLVRKHNGFIMQ